MTDQSKTSTSAPLAARDPDLPIIDCHHHLWYPHAHRYFADAFHDDIAASGHRVLATVYIEASVMLRASGPEHLKCAGEAEYAAGMAAMSDSGMFGETRICAGYVGAADFTLGDKVEETLDALAVASGGRLRGVRGSAVWDADPLINAAGNTATRPFAPPGLMRDAHFQDGVRRLAKRGLVYDAWLYYPQLPDVCALADAVPQATLVVNHCGGLLGIGAYATPDNFARWRSLIVDVARRPNVLMKIGGLSGKRTGFGYVARTIKPTEAELVSDWRPYIETCIEQFGANRCMFESNFPVDKISGSYGMLWNVFKAVAAGCSRDEKTALFSGNAARAYRLEI